MSPVEEAEPVLRKLFGRVPSIDLRPLDLVFLAALHMRADRIGLASFPEDVLMDVFEQVAALEHTEATGEEAAAKKRATHTLRRLREQRLLVRVDGGGLVRAGEYALTRLATGIVEFFLRDESLTRENLVTLTEDLQKSLERVLEWARGAESDSEWRTRVLGPLRVTSFELAQGIARRQRGFDLRQEDFQREIARLLASDWFDAVERCQSLLDTTGDTLRELHDVLLRDTSALLSLLHQIGEVGAERAREDVESAARSLAEEIDRISAWGGARQRSWADYHGHVHRFLRDVVRLDPTRALTQRLRGALRAEGRRRYALTIADAPAYRALRPPVLAALAADRPPVKRPRREREAPLESADREDPDAALEASVRAAVREGASELSEITARVTEGVALEERYRLAGRIAQIVSRVALAESATERPWVAIRERMVVEEWNLRARGEAEDEP